MQEEKRSGNDNPADPAAFDDYSAAQIARRIEAVGLAKAGLEVVPTLTLAVLAGAFISFGAMFYLVAITGTGLGLGPSRILGGLAFSLGLILVVVSGAELFTGNVLIVIGWAHRKVTSRALLRNWGLVYIGNLAGAIAMVVLAYWSGFMDMGDGAVGATAIKIAAGKVDLPFGVAFIRGLLANALVCLAMWMCSACRNVTGKILSIVFPITAFVALGFEHSIANMYFIPAGILAAADPALAQAAGVAVPGASNLGLGGLLGNLIPVTLGNIVGGGVFVALSYFLVYLHGRE